ncbi:MAG: adenylyltransferase/cytidyltransferase family protein [Candidatus Coproplasma sp.]
MTKDLSVGVFDFFHNGHLKLFECCKQHGDYLIVAVQKGEEVLKNKPDAQVLYSTQQRIEIVSAIKYVDCVVEYSQVDEDIKKIDFDVLIVRGNQNHEGFNRTIAWCEANVKSIIKLERTPDISSSSIKRNLLS